MRRRETGGYKGGVGGCRRGSKRRQARAIDGRHVVRAAYGYEHTVGHGGVNVKQRRRRLGILPPSGPLRRGHGAAGHIDANLEGM
jgi:hypothetical protein